MTDCSSSLFSLFSLSSFTDSSVFLPDSRSLNRSFSHSFLLRIYPLIHSFIYITSTIFEKYIYNLPARCHSFSSPCCNCPSFTAMSSPLAQLLPTCSSPSMATRMALLTPLPLAVQAPSRSPMVPLEVCPNPFFSFKSICKVAPLINRTSFLNPGDGSYAHPETFATALNNPDFVPCEIIYIPLLQKYFQYMDHCQECMSLYPNTIRIDLWIGSDVNGGQKQIECEDTFGLKTGQTIVRDPPSTLTVNGAPLWNNDSGTCNDVTGVFPNYSTNEAEVCSGGSGSSSSPPPNSSPAAAPPPSSSSTPAAPIPTSSTPPPSTGSTPKNEKEEVAVVDKSANIKADAKIQVKPSVPVPVQAPVPTTLATIVVSSSSSSSSSATSTSTLSSSTSSNCGVTSEWPTPWLGHCVGTPCHEFNDCSGELICQGWPNPVCTDPRSGK